MRPTSLPPLPGRIVPWNLVPMADATEEEVGNRGGRGVGEQAKFRDASGVASAGAVLLHLSCFPGIVALAIIREHYLKRWAMLDRPDGRVDDTTLNTGSTSERVS